MRLCPAKPSPQAVDALAFGNPSTCGVTWKLRKEYLCDTCALASNDHRATLSHLHSEDPLSHFAHDLDTHAGCVRFDPLKEKRLEEAKKYNGFQLGNFTVSDAPVKGFELP